jgi:signal transduction histidine kinase
MPANPFHHNLIDLIDVGVVYHHPDGRVSFGNQAALTILGVSKEQLEGKTSMDPSWRCIHPNGTAYGGEDHPAMVSIHTGKPVKDAVMGIFNPPENRFRWISVNSYPQFDTNGQLSQILVTLRDITQQRAAQEAAERSNQTLTALFDSMEEMVVLHEVLLDDQGLPINYRITDCNQAYTTITGVSKQQAVGRLATEVYQVQTPPYLEEFCQVGITGKPYFFETYFPPMEKHFSISVVSPGPLTFATISNDVTPLKKAQQLLSEKNQELEQIVYVASHDLRSPLVNVDGYARELGFSIEDLRSVLGKELSEKDNVAKTLEDFEQSVHHIRTSAQQMDKLLKGLLHLSRVGRAEIRLELISMDELMNQVLETHQYQIQQQGITLEVGNLPPCRGGYMQMTQVFSNLIGNAIKYMDPKKLGNISIQGFEELDKAWYIVADNGTGIDQKYHEKIFELFHRLDPAHSDGDGIGLTIVKQLVHKMQGTIEVQSEPGVGSQFKVTFPRV